MINPKLDFDIDLSTEKILKLKPNFKCANDVKKKLAYDFTENECTEDEKEDEKDEKEEWCIFFYLVVQLFYSLIRYHFIKFLNKI